MEWVAPLADKICTEVFGNKSETEGTLEEGNAPPPKKILLVQLLEKGQYKSTKHQSQLRILFKIPLN